MVSLNNYQKKKQKQFKSVKVLYFKQKRYFVYYFLIYMICHKYNGFSHTSVYLFNNKTTRQTLNFELHFAFFSEYTRIHVFFNYLMKH